MPILRNVFLPITISRFANAASMLIKGGVPIAQAMEIVSQTINNALYKEFFHQIANDIKAGLNLSEAMTKYPDYYFPELVPQMIAVGETTGELDKMLEKVANFYMQQADYIVTNLTDLIQPVLMLGVGILVGLLFASILIPIYNLTSVIGGI
jgi:type IV pilus assembly protein PilC